MKIVFEEENQQRLDHFLANHLEEKSRSQIERLIKSNCVLVNNKHIIKKSYKLSFGDKILIRLEDKKPIDLNNTFRKELKKTKLDIIFQNSDYLIINKPQNLTVHPGSGNEDNNLLNILLSKDIKLSNYNDRIGIVHRIDKNTSGILIIAKNNRFHEHIKNQFVNREVIKKYMGITDGHFPAREGIIDAPIGRDPNNRKTMTVISKNAKEAITNFKVIERFEKNDLIEFNIETGRTHQIRVHAKYVEAPIYNDSEYGKDYKDGYGQYLHAQYISFKNLKGDMVEYKAPLPKYFEKKIEELRKNNNDKN